MFRIIAGLASVLLASAANAVTFVSPNPGPDQGALATETYVVDFESAFAGVLTGGTIYATNTPGIAAAPFEDTTAFLGVNGSATLDIRSISTSFTSFSFYWGSIDDDNVVDVFDLDDNLIYTLRGEDLPMSNGSLTAGDTNRRVFFTLEAGETLGSVRFSNPQPAFELDDVAFGPGASVVPEPAVWGLMIAGFGMVGAAARRRRFGRAVTA